MLLPSLGGWREDQYDHLRDAFLNRSTTQWLALFRDVFSMESNKVREMLNSFFLMWHTMRKQPHLMPSPSWNLNPDDHALVMEYIQDKLSELWPEGSITAESKGHINHMPFFDIINLQDYQDRKINIPSSALTHCKKLVFSRCFRAKLEAKAEDVQNLKHFSATASTLDLAYDTSVWKNIDSLYLYWTTVNFQLRGDSNDVLMPKHVAKLTSDLVGGYSIPMTLVFDNAELFKFHGTLVDKNTTRARGRVKKLHTTTRSNFASLDLEAEIVSFKQQPMQDSISVAHETLANSAKVLEIGYTFFKPEAMIENLVHRFPNVETIRFFGNPKSENEANMVTEAKALGLNVEQLPAK